MSALTADSSGILQWVQSWNLANQIVKLNWITLYGKTPSVYATEIRYVV